MTDPGKIVEFPKYGCDPTRHPWIETPEMAALRQAVLADLPDSRVVHVYGPMRHGKTAALQHVFRTHEQDHGIAAVVDARVAHEGIPPHELAEIIVSSPFYSLSPESSRKLGDGWRDAARAELRSCPEEALAERLCAKLSEIMRCGEKDMLLLIDEIHVPLLVGSANVRAFLRAFLEDTERLRRSGLRVVTAAYLPLEWCTGAEAGAFSGIPHLRIGKIGPSIIPEFARAVGFWHRLDSNRAHAWAREIYKITGGHPSLMGEIAEGAKPHLAACNILPDWVKNGVHAMGDRFIGSQLAPCQNYIRFFPIGLERNAFLDLYETLRDGRRGGKIDDPVLALHLALSGLVELGPDGTSVRKPAPAIAAVFNRDRIAFLRTNKEGGKNTPQFRPVPLTCPHLPVPDLNTAPGG